MHIVRYYHAGSGQTLIGLLGDDGVTPLAGVASVAELMAMPLSDIRALCESAEGPRIATADVQLLPPVDGRMDVWAAGVTYKSSQIERIRESERAASVYEQVYDAERPEIFFKSTAWRVVGDGEPVQARDDSAIDVPEPELALLINRHGEITGYTICNDVSSRSIEGENPLYLPQAKVFAGGCAVAPPVRPVWEIADPYDLAIAMTIRRDGTDAWHGEANTGQLHRKLDDLVGYLFHADFFPDGALLSTGTCVVPELPFSLQTGDEIVIAIDQVGTLTNTVIRGKGGFSWLVEADGNPAARPGA